jgi:hypothetical protein
MNLYLQNAISPFKADVSIGVLIAFQRVHSDILQVTCPQSGRC